MSISLFIFVCTIVFCYPFNADISIWNTDIAYYYGKEMHNQYMAMSGEKDLNDVHLLLIESH